MNKTSKLFILFKSALYEQHFRTTHFKTLRIQDMKSLEAMFAMTISQLFNDDVSQRGPLLSQSVNFESPSL